MEWFSQDKSDDWRQKGLMKYKMPKFYGLWLGFITVCLLLAQWFSVLTDANILQLLFAIGFAGLS